MEIYQQCSEFVGLYKDTHGSPLVAAVVLDTVPVELRRNVAHEYRLTVGILQRCGHLPSNYTFFTQALD